MTADYDKINMCCNHGNLTSSICNYIEKNEQLRFQLAEYTQISMLNACPFPNKNEYNSQNPEHGAGLFDTELNHIITKSERKR